MTLALATGCLTAVSLAALQLRPETDHHVLSAGTRAFTQNDAGTKQTFAYEEATIAGIHAAMKTGSLTCHNLVQHYLNRIQAYDMQGPALNAIITINPDALTRANELDAQFEKNGFSGPLHCIPVIVKDNFNTADLRTAR